MRSFDRVKYQVERNDEFKILIATGTLKVITH